MELEEIYSRIAATREEIFRGKIKSYSFGEHKSRASSQGIDFKEINEWNRREPLRRISWPLSFASWPKKAYKLEMVDPRNAPLILLADISPSMLVRISEEANKARLLLELIGTLGSSAEYLKDPVGFCCFSDKVEFYLRYKIGRGNLFNGIKLIFDRLKELDETIASGRYRAAPNKTDVNQALYFISARIKRQCSIVILSDFSDVISGRVELDMPTLQALSARYGWNVIAVFLDDPLELDWQSSGGTVRTRDIESGTMETIRAGRIKGFRAEVETKRERLMARLKESGVDSIILAYGENGEHHTELAGFLSKRKRMIPLGG